MLNFPKVFKRLRDLGAMIVSEQRKKVVLSICFLCLTAAVACASPPDRISGKVNVSKSRTLSGSVHGLTKMANDGGPVDPAMTMTYVVMGFKRTAAQEAELEALLQDQQNPSSPNFRKWLTPEEFGARFGLSVSDESKVAAWLSAEGLTIAQHARGRNWLAFNGTAERVSSALHTSFHRFELNGRKHYANISEPAVPEALADVVGGFIGLHDFRANSNAKLGPPVDPGYTTKTGIHYLAPADWSTIYNVAPLARAGFDGTGVSIAVVGVSDISLSDIHVFRTLFGLPANDPKTLLYSGLDPGFNGAEIEGDLDLEWAGAIAPKASLYYVVGQDPFAAAFYSVDANLAQILSISYSGCESLNQGAGPVFQAVAQQANAQGITILSASGDSGAGGCDIQGINPYSAQGVVVSLPASIPEVTGVGGTQFNETGGTYWKASNDLTLGSSLSYIPEAAWNESDVANGLLAGGGGLSMLYAKPFWQQGPGIPQENRRAVPDISLTAAVSHDGYRFVYHGSVFIVGGTSAPTPSTAGVIALLNQYQVKKGFQTKPGLGNINPQLYRLAQTVPSAFHDVTSGDNIVPCLLGTQDCLNGVFGYTAGPGYDLATGLGSIDADNLFSNWNNAVSTPIVRLTLDNTRVDLNGTVTATAIVTSGAGTPTGTVAFSFSGVPIGTVPVTGSGGTATARIQFPGYLGQGTGNGLVSALYSGDAAFGSVGATASLRVTAPAAASGIILTAPAAVFPGNPDAQGLTWQAVLTLSDASGYPSLITGFTIDGQAQSVQQYIPSGNLPAFGTVAVSVVLHNLPASVTHTFAFTGIDSTGYIWERHIQVAFALARANADFELRALPFGVSQTTNPACPFPAQISLTDEYGFSGTLTNLIAGNVDISSQIPAVFGTTQLGPYGTVTGTICFDHATTPGTETIAVYVLNNAFGFQVGHDVTITFGGPAAVPVKMTPSLLTVGLSSPTASQPTSEPLSLNISDKSQPWSLTILPDNRTGGWLTASPMSGVGPAVVTITASGAGYGPGVYRALLVFQSPNASPQSVTVPVMFTLGGNSAGTSINSVGDAASFRSSVSPGSLVAVTGTALSNFTGAAPQTSGALPNVFRGVAATVNGYPAPLQYVSPAQINLQIPFEVGAGPAALGIDNNGSIAGALINVAPSSPGIFADGKGNLVPTPMVKQGASSTLYLTGAGVLSPAIATGVSPAPGTSLTSLPSPLLPVSVSVSGTPVFVTFVGNPVSAVGVTQVNFIVPAWVPAGPQTLAVTINGVTSSSVNIQVVASGNSAN